MASTLFIDYTTPIVAAWLNDVNTVAYTTVPAILTALAVRVSKTSDTGSAILPVGTSAERDGSPAVGYMRYNTTLAQFEGYGAAGWGKVGGGATGGGTDAVFLEADNVVTTDYTITTGKNAVTPGPITINNGVIVTVPNGSVWTIV